MAADTAFFFEGFLPSGGVAGMVCVYFLEKEGENVGHFLGVQPRVRLAAADPPEHAWSVIPQHCSKPTHRRCNRAYSRQIRGNVPARAID
jgi:hypothetical protein